MSIPIPSIPIPNIALMKAIKLMGGQTNLGAALSQPASQKTVSKWLVTGRLPAERCVQIVAACGFHPEVTLEGLRPDLFAVRPKTLA